MSIGKEPEDEETYPPEPRKISMVGMSPEFVRYMLWRASMVYGLHEVYVFETPEAAKAALADFQEACPDLFNPLIKVKE